MNYWYPHLWGDVLTLLQKTLLCCGGGFQILTFVVVGRVFPVPDSSQEVILLFATMPAVFT